MLAPPSKGVPGRLELHLGLAEKTPKSRTSPGMRSNTVALRAIAARRGS